MDRKYINILVDWASGSDVKSDARVAMNEKIPGTGHHELAPDRPVDSFVISRKPFLIILTVLLLGSAVALVRYLGYGRYIETTNDAYLKADIVDIAPKLQGYVEQVLVDDNQAVRKGAPLVRISVTDSAAQASQLDAELAAARAAVAQAETRLLSQDAAIRSARADEDDARSRLTYMRGEVARYEPLARSGAESREKLAQLRQLRATAEASLERSGAQVTVAEHQRDVLSAELEGARARIAAIQAQQQRAKSDVDLTILRSSIDGRIGDRTVRVGQFVRPGQRLMSVVPVQSIYVVANFKETQVKQMRVGQPVNVVVDALDEGALRGKIDSFSPGTGSEFALLPPQNATGNFTKIVQRVPVKIRLIDPLPPHRIVVPGMSVVVSVDTRAEDD